MNRKLANIQLLYGNVFNLEFLFCLNKNLICINLIILDCGGKFDFLFLRSLNNFHMDNFLYSSSAKLIIPEVILSYFLYKFPTFALFLHKKTAEYSAVCVCLATSYSHRGKPPTTIGAKELNFRVRYGNGCDLFAIITRLIWLKEVYSFKTG